MKIAVKREAGLILVEIFDENGELDYLVEFIDDGEDGHLFTKESQILSCRANKEVTE